MTMASWPTPVPTTLTEEQCALVLQVAERVESIPHAPLSAGDAFWMADWGTSGSCGTTACIAGWTVAVADGPDALHDPNCQISARACELLGVVYDHGGPGHSLFVSGPSTVGLDMAEVTGQMAARVLRHMVEHQEVDWRQALTEEEWAAREIDLESEEGAQ